MVNWNLVWGGALIGAMMGAGGGLAALLYGLLKRQPRVGFLGFAISVLAGALFGSTGAFWGMAAGMAMVEGQCRRSKEKQS